MEVIQENLDSLVARAKKKDKLEELDNEFDCFEEDDYDLLELEAECSDIRHNYNGLPLSE